MYDDIKEAIKSCDLSRLEKLSNNFDYKVRRAVARNPNTPVPILEKLQKDPAMNVAYWANSKLEKKDIYLENEDKNPCVICEKSEDTFHYECKNCEKDSYSIILKNLLKVQYVNK